MKDTVSCDLLLLQQAVLLLDKIIIQSQSLMKTCERKYRTHTLNNNIHSHICI